jgi:hypothetical protein
MSDTSDTSDTFAFLQNVYEECNDIHKSLHSKTHPQYGNAILALNRCESLGAKLLDYIPTLQNWLEEYESNASMLWLQYMLDIGTNHKERNIRSDDYANEWKRVEKVYTGAFDISYSKALQTRIQVAEKATRVPYRHEGPCWGGIICIVCDGDKWEWYNQCKEEANISNISNIFCNAIEGLGIFVRLYSITHNSPKKIIFCKILF